MQLMHQILQRIVITKIVLKETIGGKSPPYINLLRQVCTLSVGTEYNIVDMRFAYRDIKSFHRKYRIYK